MNASPAVPGDAMGRRRFSRAAAPASGFGVCSPAAGMPALRLVTYNLRSCTVSRGRGTVDRAAAILATLAPDVVALQEVETGHARSGFHHQAEALAARLEMTLHFQPAFHGPAEGASFGNALLSRLPMRVVASGLLPRRPLGPWREPRGASWIAVTADGLEVQVLATHLGLHRRERLAQLAALLGPAWLGDPRCRPPRLLCGDFNCRPGSPEHRLLEGVLVDAVLVAPPGGGRTATYPALRPLVRIDHVMVSPDLRVRRTEIPRGPELRRVSDHLPLAVELELPGAAGG